MINPTVACLHPIDGSEPRTTTIMFEVEPPPEFSFRLVTYVFSFSFDVRSMEGSLSTTWIFIHCPDRPPQYWSRIMLEHERERHKHHCLRCNMWCQHQEKLERYRCLLPKKTHAASGKTSYSYLHCFVFIFFNYLMDPTSRAPEELQAAAYAKVMPIIRSGAHILFWASLHNVEGLISCQRKCSTVSWQPSYSLVTERQFCKLVEFF